MSEELRILCVDDETNVLKSLRRLFMDEDYDIITAPSGVEGLELLKEYSDVQVVIADYRMPVMNGVDFLKEVRKDRPDTVRIVLSGYADASSIISAINEGHIYKFIPKPWNDDDLKINISHAMERYFLHKKNKELTIELQKKNDTLKELLSEKTEESNMSKKLLAYTHNFFQEIFTELPIGMLGIDAGGNVVQCNESALSLLGCAEKDIIWTHRRKTLPVDLNSFVDMVVENDAVSGEVLIGGKNLYIKGFVVRREGWVGIILVFGWGSVK